MTEDAQQTIAADLGVSQKTVSNSVDELQESGKLSKLTKLNTNEKREHLPEPPEAADTDAEVMWPDDDDAWTYEGVAHELGVSFALVRDAILDSVQICISTNLNIPSEREQKRDAVRSYIENNRDRVTG